ASPKNVKSLIPSLPRSHKGNTELLIWVDLFTGYVIAKASSSRSAQTVAESYKECVFRRFGDSEMIRHDREPGFMSDFFRAFNKILGQRQRATMAYHHDQSAQYVRDVDQKDWDEYAERLTFAFNTAHDRMRGDTPHYLIDIGGYTAGRMYETARSRCAAVAISSPTRYYQQSREQVNARLKEVIADRADRHNEGVGSHQIDAGSRIWLYLDRVKEGYARKLAHLWHGPFRVAEKINEFSVKLEIAGTRYQIFPVVHMSKLKLVKDFPDRPRVELTVDEILLLEDSWVPDFGADEYAVEQISDVRSGKKTRFGRIYREFLVHWAGYDEPTWVDEADLNCGAILNAFLRERANRNRFNVMKSHEGM
ncbi:reverse transcriptase, partial [Phytophthora megakarya]